MKVLVVGGSGFIGSNLIDELVKHGHNVGATFFTSRNQLINSEKVDWHHADSRNLEELKSFFGNYEVVVMCAAVTSGSAVIRSTPMVHVHDNIVMNMRCLQAAYESGVQKYLFLSSNTVYPNSNRAMREVDVTGEFFPAYVPVATMKLVTEKLASLYPNLNPPMQSIIIRPGNAFGPRDDFDLSTAKVIPSLIRKIVERRRPLVIWGDGEELKDFIYITDLVRGIRLALESDSSETIFNIAQGNTVSINEVIEKILDIEGIPNWPVAHDVSKLSMIPVREIDISRARKVLNFEPEFELRAALEMTIQWFKDNSSQS